MNLDSHLNQYTHSVVVFPQYFYLHWCRFFPVRSDRNVKVLVCDILSAVFSIHKSFIPNVPLSTASNCGNLAFKGFIGLIDFSHYSSGMPCTKQCNFLYKCYFCFMIWAMDIKKLQKLKINHFTGLLTVRNHALKVIRDVGVPWIFSCGICCLEICVVLCQPLCFDSFYYRWSCLHWNSLFS